MVLLKLPSGIRSRLKFPENTPGLGEFPPRTADMAALRGDRTAWASPVGTHGHLPLLVSDAAALADPGTTLVRPAVLLGGPGNTATLALPMDVTHFYKRRQMDAPFSGS